MATKEVITLDIAIQNAQAAKSLEEMQKALKDLISQQKQVARGTDDWKKLSQAINDAEGEIGDLTDSFNTLRGSGVDRLNASTGLLREGFENFDTGKIKLGLQGIGAAMKAIPIFLLVEGVMKLVENFDELKDSTGLLGKAFTAIGDLIDWIGDKISDFADYIGLIDKELDQMSEGIEEFATKSTEALQAQNAEFDRQIKVAAAAGKSTVEFEKAKQAEIIKTNKAIIDQIVAFVRSGGELSENQRKLLASSLENIRNAKAEEKAIVIKEETAKRAEYKKTYDERKKLQDAERLTQAEDDERAKDIQLKADQKFAEDQLALLQAQKEAEQAYLDEVDKREEARLMERIAKEKALEEEQLNAKKEALNVGFEAARATSEALFAWQLRAAEGDEKKQLEIKKRMFAVDKAFNVARAVQDGIRSVQAALTIPPPGGQILAGVNAALAAANVAKILATKFEGGTTGGGGGEISAPSPTALPTPQSTSAPNIQPTTTFDEQGRNTSNRVYVVESDITKTQNRVNLLEEQATIK